MKSFICRRRRFILAMLALGVVSTVLTSWVFACFEQIPMPGGRYFYDDGQIVWRVASVEAPGWRIWNWMVAYSWQDGATPEGKSEVFRHLEREGRRDLLGSWTQASSGLSTAFLSTGRQNALSTLRTLPENAEDRLPGLTDVALPATGRGFVTESFGLPMNAMWRATESQQGNEKKRFGSISAPFITVEMPIVDREPGPARLPIFIHPVGFLANAAFYTSIWTLLIGSPLALLALRRHLRTRKGGCPRCGYNLKGITGATCPECGHGLEAAQIG